jgi:hypothetical protein
MLNKRTLFAGIIAALVAGNAWGQSQQPTPSRGENAGPPQAQSTQPAQKSSNDQRGTEQSPVIVKVLPAENEKQKASAEAKRENQKTANDDRLARFTENLFWATVALSVIAGFQLFVFGWQGVQLSRTVAEMKLARRPWLQIVEAKVVGQVRISGKTANVTLNMTLKNCGKTPAENVTMPARIFEFEDINIAVQYSGDTAKFQTVLGGHTIFPDEILPDQSVIGFTLPPLNSIKQRQSLLVAGGVAYRAAGMVHVTPFIYWVSRFDGAPIFVEADVAVDAADINFQRMPIGIGPT